MKKIKSFEIVVCDVCGESQSLDEPEPMTKCKCGRDVCSECSMNIRISPSMHQRCEDSDPNAVGMWRDVNVCPECGKRITEILDAFQGVSIEA